MDEICLSAATQAPTVTQLKDLIIHVCNSESLVQTAD